MQHVIRAGEWPPWAVRSRGMKVFLSWSKEPSKSIATFLRGWLTDVIQSLDPWMSGEDIAVGERWANKISGELEGRNFGILILTPENQREPWINYEAGALAKMVGSSRVIPYTFGFKPSEISSNSPLNPFQGVEATKEGTWRMLSDINKALLVPLVEDQLRRAFERNWSDLDNELKRIAAEETDRRESPSPVPGPIRPDSDKLDEVLLLMRNISSGPQGKADAEPKYRLKSSNSTSKHAMNAFLEELVNETSGVYAFSFSSISNKVTFGVSEEFIEDIDSMQRLINRVTDISPRVEVTFEEAPF